MEATDRFLTLEQIDKFLGCPPHKIILTTDTLLSKVLTSLGIQHQLIGHRFPYSLLADYYKKTVVLHLKDHIIDIRQIPQEKPHSIPLTANEYPAYEPSRPIRSIDLTHPDSITHLENFLNDTNNRTPSDLRKNKN